METYRWKHFPIYKDYESKRLKFYKLQKVGKHFPKPSIPNIGARAVMDGIVGPDGSGITYGIIGTDARLPPSIGLGIPFDQPRIEIAVLIVARDALS